MNIILINTDTWRRDYLGCYGNEWIHTEYLDAFAKDAMIFDRAYVGSFPTGPMRFDLFTGRFVFAYSEWNDKLHLKEQLLPQVLTQAGFTTMFIVDNPHMLRDGNNFDKGFKGFWWIRGQEFDRTMTSPPDDKDRDRDKYYQIEHLRNKRLWNFEEDYPVAKTMHSAVRWLELNYDQHEKFFLHIETFDPHEPWDPPKWYTELYDKDWEGGDIAHASYGMGWGDKETHDASQLSERELKRLKALYSGNITLCDRWIGKLFQKIEDLGLYENTMIIFTTDHGTLLGEHGYIHKRGYGGIDPMYEETARIPFIVRMPDSWGKFSGRNDALVQPADVMPTILDYSGIYIPKSVQGQSFLPIIRGEKQDIRENVVSCGALYKPPKRLTVTTKEWAYIPVNDKAEFDDLGRKVEPELYNIRTDPQQLSNIYKKHPDVVNELHEILLKNLQSLGSEKGFLSKHRDIDSFFLKYADGSRQT